jgi:hypothetical protein
MIRLPAVVALLMACVALINHCALGGMERARAGAAHACCESGPTQPAKAPPTFTACCKALQIVPETAKASAPQAVVTSMAEFAAYIVAAEVHPQFVSTYQFTDHSPPGVISFAEAVLQRSLRNHAPPAA